MGGIPQFCILHFDFYIFKLTIGQFGLGYYRVWFVFLYVLSVKC